MIKCLRTPATTPSLRDQHKPGASAGSRELLNGATGVISFGSSISIVDVDALKFANTLMAAERQVTTGAHDFYGDPNHKEIGGKNATDHSVKHLNYWGPASR